jgi:glycosyltransferase involved in cell wall biosynthesis
MSIKSWVIKKIDRRINAILEKKFSPIALRLCHVESRVCHVESRVAYDLEPKMNQLLHTSARYNMMTNQIVYLNQLDQLESVSEFQPKVSIVIPVYNGSNYLRQAVESALAQTYDNIEIIVVNDGSNNDETLRIEKIVNSFADDSKIKYYSKPNGGVSSALNLGISKMAGEYFAWLSHDDYYYPNHIEAHINHLKRINNRDEVITYTCFDAVNEKGTILPLATAFQKFYLFDWKVSILEKNALLYLGEINGGNVLLSRSVFEKIGLFDESLRISQERDMWFRCSSDYAFVNIPFCTTATRIHQERVSTNDGVVENSIEKNIEIILNTPKETKIALFGSEANFYTMILEKYKCLNEEYGRMRSFLEEKIREAEQC